MVDSKNALKLPIPILKAYKGQKLSNDRLKTKNAPIHPRN